MKITRLLAFFVLLLPAQSFAAESVRNTHTTISLVSEKSSINTGEAEGFRVAVRVEAHDKWHTYWENPGDAGLATSLTWTLPDGFTASSIDWPAPTRLNEGPLAIYAYEGEVMLPVTITPPATLDTGDDIPLKVHVDLLVCNDICVPESADLELSLPISSTPSRPSNDAKLFEKQNLERVLNVQDTGGFKIADHTITLTVPLKDLSTGEPGTKPPTFADIRAAQFFPRQQNLVQYATDQMMSGDKKNLSLILQRAENGDAAQQISGILTLTLPKGNHSYNITFEPKTMPVMGSSQSSTLIFPVALLLALIGGLVLNLMPCVLPVLSLKALALAKKSGHAQGEVIRQGVAYTLGIAASFAVISGLLLVLRAGGESVGWGYQMQSPVFVAILAYLLFLVGLSLSGLFHLPVLLGGVGHGITSQSSAKGSFLTGILATAVATPCTAPFMAPAIGAALTMPAWQALLVFQALGLGLALPYLLICFFPALRAFLPKPGAWMENFKQLMAFPMYASVIWLLWVLTLQTGVSGMVVALTALLLLTFIIWMKAFFKDESKAYRVLALLLTAVTLYVSLHTLAKLNTDAIMEKPAAAHAINTVPYSKDALASLRAAGKPVFVDATAAWCITCQVNASVALHTTRTMAAFEKQGITLMIADWTRRNDDITEFLAGFGFNGVPLNVFYPPADGEPVVLPQILSEDIVIQTITTKGQ